MSYHKEGQRKYRLKNKEKYNEYQKELMRQIRGYYEEKKEPEYYINGVRVYLPRC